MKKVIAVDIDDVLAVENDAVRQFANLRYGHQHKPEDYLVPGEYWGYWEQVQGVDRKEGARRYAEYLASGSKSRLEVMDGGVETLTWLKRRFNLVVVTAREAEFTDVTRIWLERHFPDTFHDVAFVAVWTGSVKGSKADICRDLHAEYLIDDNVGHLQLASKAGVKGLLFGDYGWSKNKDLPPQTTRVADWKAVKEFFEHGTGR